MPQRKIEEERRIAKSSTDKPEVWLAAFAKRDWNVHLKHENDKNKN